MIQREEKEWGVRLSMQPLTGRPSMQIIAEVDNPKPGRKPDTRYWFDGAGSEKPLRPAELTVWQEGLRQFQDVVKDVQARLMKPATKTSAKKKR